MNNMNFPKMDKSAFSISNSFDDTEERQFWCSKTPLERLEALEIYRQIIYGYDPSTDRLQRFFEVTQRTSS
jgi:hypothetical protein